MRRPSKSTRKHEVGPDFAAAGFVRSIVLQRELVESFGVYPYNLPAVRNLYELPLHPRVTYFVGENGTGKSTLIEPIAVARSS